MPHADLKFGTFFWRIASSHIATYFLMGLMAASVLDYKEAFDTAPLSHLMKPFDSPWVAAGPMLQVFRGLVFAVVLWPFRTNFIHVTAGWLKLWALIMGLCVLSTTGPATGSIEGLIYTKIPVATQLKGYLEVLPQTLLFALSVFYWYEKPGKLWNVLSIVAVVLVFLLCTLALLIR